MYWWYSKLFGAKNEVLIKKKLHLNLIINCLWFCKLYKGKLKFNIKQNGVR